ncbi:metal-dependent hydrolase, partial [Candidatus Bathyarchaeota archaeon]|nr:metal-dependent hydrolase [Candidatus Bathyarchaeota archaeon]
MFLLGHSCWSYLFSKSSAHQLKTSMPAYLAFLSGVLPDFDIYFQPLGLVHHTYTHSLLVIVPIVTLLTYFLGRFGLALSIGITSHLLGDSIVGTIPILYPVIPDYTVGLNLGLPSLADTTLEMGAFLL